MRKSSIASAEQNFEEESVEGSLVDMEPKSDAHILHDETLHSSKPTLASFLKEKLAEQAILIQAAAEYIGVSASSLRNWLHRNKFPKDALADLVRLLNDRGDLEIPDINSLGDQYEFGLTRTHARYTDYVEALLKQSSNVSTQITLPQALQTFDNKVREFFSQFRKFESEVQLLISSMGKGDVYFFASLTEKPYEWDTVKGFRELSWAIKRAVSEGSYFVYLTPSIELRDNLVENLGFEDILEPRIIDRAFERFVTLLCETWKLNQDENSSIDDGEIEAIVKSKVLHIPWTPSVFMTPGNKYMLFEPQAFGGETRSIASFSVGGQNAGIPLSVPLNVPLDQKTTWCFSQAIRTCIDSILTGGTDSIHFKNIRNLQQHLLAIQTDLES